MAAWLRNRTWDRSPLRLSELLRRRASVASAGIPNTEEHRSRRIPFPHFPRKTWGRAMTADNTRRTRLNRRVFSTLSLHCIFLALVSGVYGIAGLAIKVDADMGRMCAQEADDLAARSGEPALMPIVTADVTDESFVLRGIGDPDYAGEESCKNDSAFGSFLPEASALPDGVKLLVGGVLQRFGAHRVPPKDFIPMFDVGSADRQWERLHGEPCTRQEDDTSMEEFSEAWGEQEKEVVSECGLELLKAAGKLLQSSQMPLVHPEALRKGGPGAVFCAKCLPLYASAAYAVVRGQPRLASEGGECQAEESAAIADSVLLLNFAWAILNHQHLLLPPAPGLSKQMVKSEHRRWMLLLGRCVGPQRRQRLAEQIPIKYPLLNQEIRGQYLEQTKHLEPLEPSGYDFSFPVNFVLLPFLLSPEQMRVHRRRVLIDAGAGGPFWWGTGALVDMYEDVEGARFEEVMLIEPDPGRVAVPPDIEALYNVTVWNRAVRVGTREAESDLLVMMRDTLQLEREDFVVLKFDCDVGAAENSMEWGFLADLLVEEEALGLVDELFIEMHYFHPAAWKNEFAAHSIWQHLDLLRQLRARGIVVHPWP